VTVLGWVKVAVLASVVVATVWHGIAGPPKLLAWGMFTRVRFCRIDAYIVGRDGAERELDQWRWTPHENLPMGVARLERLLGFVAGLGSLHGAVTVVDGAVARRWDIVDGELDL
jgi:hypothetical protein